MTETKPMMWDIRNECCNLTHAWGSRTARGCCCNVLVLVLSPLLSVYSCALLRDILLQGRLYISRNWLCFYANLFGKDIKVRMSDIQAACVSTVRLTESLPANTWQAEWTSTLWMIWQSVGQDNGQIFSVSGFISSHSLPLSQCNHVPGTGRLTELLTLTSYMISLFDAVHCSCSLISLKPNLSWHLSDNKLLIQPAFLTFWLKLNTFHVHGLILSRGFPKCITVPLAAAVYWNYSGDLSHL